MEGFAGYAGRGAAGINGNVGGEAGVILGGGGQAPGAVAVNHIIHIFLANGAEDGHFLGVEMIDPAQHFLHVFAFGGDGEGADSG